MKIKLFLALLLLTCLVVSQQTAQSKSWTPGVAKGDYFYFEMYGVYSSNRSDILASIPYFEQNNTDWTRIDITDVQGSVIHQVYTLHFKDGSEGSFNFKTDVNPANRSNLAFSEKGVPICTANIAAGDVIPTVELTINDTTMRSYPDGLRETNHATWNYSDDWGDCYFDVETGMLVELCRTHRFDSGGSGGDVEKTDVIKLVGTNRWNINESSTPPPSAFASVVAIFVLALLVLSFKVLPKLG